MSRRAFFSVDHFWSTRARLVTRPQYSVPPTGGRTFSRLYTSSRSVVRSPALSTYPASAWSARPYVYSPTRRFGVGFIFANSFTTSHSLIRADSISPFMLPDTSRQMTTSTSLGRSLGGGAAVAADAQAARNRLAATIRRSAMSRPPTHTMWRQNHRNLNGPHAGKV